MKLKQLFKFIAVPMLSIMTGISAHATQKVTIKAELASPIVLENAQDKNYLKISLTGFPLEIKKRSPINLALVIDRSPSMSGDRIEKARDAAIMTVNMLNSNDTLSVVAYDNSTQVIIPPTKVTNKEQLIKKIRQNLDPRGMTALFAGVSKGIEQVSKNLDKEQINRIILLSDGQANVGPTSVKELSELAKIAAQKGIAITTVGIGNGYNEDLMTAIAGYSDGNHAFVANTADLEKIFNQEFKDVMSVVAQDVEVVITTASNVKPVRLLGRDGEIVGNTITVKLNQLYSNQEKYVLLEVIPAKGTANQQTELADVQVRYDNLSTKKQDIHKEKVAVRYTKSQEVAKQAQQEEVIVEVAIQENAAENERAIKLIEQGKKAEAQAVLKTNAYKMSNLPVSKADAKMKMDKAANQNIQLSEQVEMLDSSSSRKVLKESNYKTKKQQSN